MDRLSDALSSALECFPIFATTLEYADGKYSLVNNNAKPPLMQLDGPLPRFLGKESGGYLFRLVAGGEAITLEWSRAITDAFYASDFFSAILSASSAVIGAGHISSVAPF